MKMPTTRTTIDAVNPPTESNENRTTAGPFPLASLGMIPQSYPQVVVRQLAKNHMAAKKAAASALQILIAYTLLKA